MHRYPYITPYLNQVFSAEKKYWDFRFLRPVLLVSYFFIRLVSFPIKFVLRRSPLGFEGRLIDWCMTFGLKYLARTEAAELFIRHTQIEPIIYRYILSKRDQPSRDSSEKLNGIDGDFNLESLAIAKRNNLTIGHDLLSYELVDRFDKQSFLENIEYLRSIRPEEHEKYSKTLLDETRRHSFQLLGPTSLVILVVIVITICGDLKTTVTALNSFGSDSLLLWCMKRLYVDNPSVLTDLDFFMQEVSNRGHYNSSVFFSNPSQYLYYHVVFDEVVYDLLMNEPFKPEENCVV